MIKIITKLTRVEDAIDYLKSTDSTEFEIAWYASYSAGYINESASIKDVEEFLKSTKGKSQLTVTDTGSLKFSKREVDNDFEGLRWTKTYYITPVNNKEKK